MEPLPSVRRSTQPSNPASLSARDEEGHGLVSGKLQRNACSLSSFSGSLGQASQPRNVQKRSFRSSGLEGRSRKALDIIAQSPGFHRPHAHTLTHAHSCTPHTTHTRTRTHTHLPRHSYTHTHAHTRLPHHSYTHMHAHTHSHMHTHMCARTHTHSHTHLAQPSPFISFICCPTWRA